MEKILNITDRLEDKKKEKRKETHRQRAETVMRTVQCSSCQHSCAMCGYHFEANNSSCPHAAASSKINLCEHCRAEYNDFLKATRGMPNPEVSWHNNEWVRLWSAWVEFRSSLNDFRNSPEFRKLIKDLE